MSEDEQADFLGRGGTGVLSFATDADVPPVVFPVSYGYDADTTSFYFRLAFPAGTQKADVIGNPVAFATHSQTDSGWRSVVATGVLEEMTNLPYNSSAVQGMWAVRIPQIDIFDRPPDEIPFRNFRLVPETMTGRKEVQSES